MTECNKIIHKVAREMLKPMGFVQLGSGRFYAKDYGYFLIMITYKPMSYCEGTYMEVFVSFYFDYFIKEVPLLNNYYIDRFNDEIREKKYDGIYDENMPEKFEKAVGELTKLAIEAVDEYSKLGNLDYACEAYGKHYEPTTFWYYYTYGILLLFSGHYDEGIEYLKKTVEELKNPTLPYKIVPTLRQKIERDLEEKYTSKEKAQEEVVNMVNYIRCRLASESRYKRLKLERPFELEEQYK